MDIKLLALDIDGTLLNSQYHVSDENRRAIHQARSRGVDVVLVTGRRFAFALPVVRELGLHTPLICHNGALTKQTDTWAVIDYYPLAAETARQVVSIGKQLGADMICSYDPEGYGRLVFESLSPESLRLRTYMPDNPIGLEQVDDLCSHIQHDPIQVMSTGTCDRIDRLEAALVTALNDRATLLKTAYPQRNLSILDVLAPQCSKGRALERLVQRSGLRREQVMAVGDNHNDVHMLEFAGIGVVMANAEEPIKRAPFYITASNDEHGVAEAIARFILRD